MSDFPEERLCQQQSVLSELLRQMPQLRSHLYFKSSLTALSHAMEDRVLAGTDRPLLIASFQQEKFYRQEAHRYRRLGEISDQVYVLAAPDTEFSDRVNEYDLVPFTSTDALASEWHLVAIGAQSSACLICREKIVPPSEIPVLPEIDASRRFEGIWTFDRQVTIAAAHILLDRIKGYRPDLAAKIAQAKQEYLVAVPTIPQDHSASADAFVQRLVTYLQARQYKLLKAYRSIEEKEERERLVNTITGAIRRSLNSADILQVAGQEIGKATGVSRCLIYQYRKDDRAVTIAHEYLANSSITSLVGKSWNLADNPIFKEVVTTHESISLAEVSITKTWQRTLDRQGINDWLIVPVLHQDRLLGAIELHQHEPSSLPWSDDTINLVEAIATQIGSTLIQAESYTNLEYLNQQLEALDRTRANLVAITGHELRTPLSTIQVCLESLATEPDMSLEMRQVMLNTALGDAERMRKLVQDFLTLSQLESGRIQWHPEPLSLEECIDLALSGLNTRRYNRDLPKIVVNLPPNLPFVRADGEWLVEVLTKLLDNACKFTTGKDRIAIEAAKTESMLEVIVADTGRGIAPELLQMVFERFYQAEGSLRRTAGGTGLGLAICRQIVNGWGGEIWAESAGKDCGSRFHFTVPSI
ncbi:DICT sensory domain-containing protein [Chamaesiphon minutus]|uniref:histidine kinase n=1 Tax=Chamaesiphon minutus (strain ATCC 27169 / PCC 6605) TaxID=1173020 RepID=K9UHF8_CHAP6|nr:DICT sensory domain-containing protein [Chamaesiphon minutus]AFY94083.1 putative sensor protein/domain protein [Chamaesiphon minutus PCC 6605]